MFHSESISYDDILIKNKKLVFQQILEWHTDWEEKVQSNRLDKIVKGSFEMLYLFVGILAFGVIVYVITSVMNIRKSNRELDELFEK